MGSPVNWPDFPLFYAMHPSRILITGVTGQLGREFLDYTKTNRDITWRLLGPEELNITNPIAVQEEVAKFKPDVFINCAAYTAVDNAEEEFEAAENVNHHAVRTMAESCKEVGAKFVHISTDYVFNGKAEDQKKYPEGYPEDAPVDPVNKYGLSKLNGEKAIQDSGSDYLIIRVSWLCGKYGHNFVKSMLKHGAERDELKVVNDQFGSPTYTADLVDATFKILNARESGIYHISSSGMITWHEFATEIISSAGLKAKVTPITSDQWPMKAKRPFFSKLNNGKFEKKFKTKYDWKSGLRKLLDEIT